MQRRRTAFTLVEVLFVLGILLVLVMLILPLQRGGAREASRRNACWNNLKQMTFALHSYVEVHGEAPPAYTVDAEGNRLHSWRTLLLPYLEEQALYDQIDLTKPWDDPANAEARKARPLAFMCYSAELDNERTGYLAVVGPGCAMNGSDPWSLDDITDGAANTVWVVEGPAGRAVHWMSPEDVEPDDVLAFSESDLNHPGVVLVGCVDGSVRSVQQDTPRDRLRAMLTAAAGDSIADE